MLFCFVPWGNTPSWLESGAFFLARLKERGREARCQSEWLFVTGGGGEVGVVAGGIGQAGHLPGLRYFPDKLWS